MVKYEGGGGLPQLGGNAVGGNGLNGIGLGGTLAVSLSLPVHAGLPFVVDDLVVGAGVSLTVEPGG